MEKLTVDEQSKLSKTSTADLKKTLLRVGLKESDISVMDRPQLLDLVALHRSGSTSSDKEEESLGATGGDPKLVQKPLEIWQRELALQ